MLETQMVQLRLRWCGEQAKLSEARQCVRQLVASVRDKLVEQTDRKFPSQNGRSLHNRLEFRMSIESSDNRALELAARGHASGGNGSGLVDGSLRELLEKERIALRSFDNRLDHVGWQRRCSGAKAHDGFC